MRDAVKHLDSAPFLQLVWPEAGAHRERHRVAPSLIHTPQLWQAVAQHLSHRKPEVVVFLHRIAVEDTALNKPCLFEGLRQSSTEKLFTGIAAHDVLQQDCLHRSALAAKRELEHRLLSGRVGECCDDDDHLHTSFSGSQHSIVDQQLEDHWGLVVQSKHASDIEGCYVLKTTRNANPTDCQCTYYTLTKVCRGAPLAAQLSSAWLV